MVDWFHWASFLAFLVLLLALDLFVLHRRAREVPFKQALVWTAVWVGLALAFGGVLLLWRGAEVGGEYAAGYLIEWSLSVDNVFVFVLIFTHFAVPAAYQHRVLFWGVLGAILLRLSFILGGSALLNRFHWVIYVFGGLLVVTAVRFLAERTEGRSLEESVILRLTRRVLPITESFQGQRLVVRRGRGVLATPLLAVLVVIEATDVVFAIDSVPAVFSVTRDAFVAFTSNAMAILGLRSLYFVLARAMGRFRYVKPALAAILAFVGVKMLLTDVVEIPVAVSLVVIAGILATGIGASVLRPAPEVRRPPVGS
ncbi:MAG TPA: TerC family protein [Actinomycetota bacterium]